MTVWQVDIRRRFEHAHRSFELQVRFASAARRLVLFGPSGAGKSQTLKIIAGLTLPDGGHVRLQGETLLGSAAGIALPARERRLGYVFQDYALFPHLTVMQNIAFGLQRGWRNPPRARAQSWMHPQVQSPVPQAVARWVAAFQLGPVAHHHPEQLSGGQRQRTALARALVAGPRALLLDEPFAALDAHLRARLRNELAELLEQVDIPLILITHDEVDLQRFGDEVVEIHEGRVQASPPRPASSTLPPHSAP